MRQRSGQSAGASKPVKRPRSGWLPRFNVISRMTFLILTPVLFCALNFAFVWHSIYRGAITLVVLLWSLMIVISPLLGRVGCGWICFIGTIQDIASEHAFFRIPWREPLHWPRLAGLVAFFATSLTFFFVRLSGGRIHGVTFSPLLLNMNFNTHYKVVWMCDAMGALLLGLLLERRWACRNTCAMGLLCAAGASYSRLIPVVDTARCNLCGICEESCPVRIPIREYVSKRGGLVTNPECLVCGKCGTSCRRDAIRIRFVWNRRFAASAVSTPDSSR
jgi:polyferredoxin